MKKFKILTVALFAFLAMGIGTSFASESPVKTNDEKVVLAHCEISDGGFHASGRCSAVLKAYQRWKAMQK